MHKLVFFLALLSLQCFGSNQNVCTNKVIESLPIQQNGRVKPLLVHAKDTIKFLTGNLKQGLPSKLEVYCKLSYHSQTPTKFYDNLATKIEHVDTRKFLNTPSGKINIIQLLRKEEDIKTEYFLQKQNNAYKKELSKTLSKIQLFQSIISGEDFMVFKNNEWVSLSKIGFDFNFEKMKQNYITTVNDDYLLELKYFKWHLFSWAMLLSLLGIVANILIKRNFIPLGICSLSVLIQLIAMIMRIFISGRAPVTNMYETVMFSGLGALILSMIIGHFKQERLFISIGLGYNFLCLMMMTFANSMLSPSISPLVPVLRDNFWLSTHVTSIVLSYGALALSWLLSNYALYLYSFRYNDKERINYYVSLIYSAIKYGVVLLSGGIILGGVWADYSWGRFWGWDPKETWSLIVLLIYMAILHGKYTSFINNQRFIPLVAAAFLSVMMAWFGVNYILAQGLHSYGFSEGGAIFLGTFFLVQIGYIVVCVGKQKLIKMG